MSFKILRRNMTWFCSSMLLVMLLCISGSLQVRAEEHVKMEENSGGILQNGGLLQEEKDTVVMPKGAFGADLEKIVPSYGADYAGAEKALINGIKNFNTRISLSAYNISVDSFSDFFVNFVNNHPEFFYLGGQYGCSYSGGMVIDATVQYISYDTSSMKKMVTTYENKVKKILSSVNSSWSNLEKALYVNDYLAINCEYDNSLSKFSSYNALVEGTAVCQGYALAYLDLMKRMNIPCELVTSDKLDHAWNLVKIGSSWYHVDVTWNDPVSDRYGRARHLYFLKSANYFHSFSGGHVSTDYVFSGSAGDAQAKSTSFDNAFWNSIETSFFYYKGYWYGNDGGNITRYTASNSGLKKSKVIKKADDMWPEWGGFGYWGNFSGAAVYGGKFYYATPESILSLNLASPGTSPKTVYRLTTTEKRQGYIYGFYITAEGVLKYEISTNPNYVGIRKKVNIHSHSYGSWKTTKKSTCTKKGVKTRTCSCGVKQTASIPAAGHKNTKVVTKAATFQRAGSQKTICKDCNATIKTKTLSKKQCKKGQNYTVGNYKYKIISAKINGQGTVAFIGLAKKTKNVKIGDTVTILGSKFKIVQIGDRALKNQSGVVSVTIGKNVQSIGKEAFYGARKLQTITIKSQKLTKVGAQALRNIHAKAKIKVPASKLSKYKKLLRNKGQKNTVKISK